MYENHVADSPTEFRVAEVRATRLRLLREEGRSGQMGTLRELVSMATVEDRAPVARLDLKGKLGPVCLKWCAVHCG